MSRILPRQLRTALPGLVLAMGGAFQTAAAQDWIVVLPEAGTPVIATEVLVALSAPDEEEVPPGIAYLAGRAVTAPIAPTLDSLGAHLSVRAYKDALGFSLVVPPETWEEASRTLLVALFRDPLDSAATERERRAIRAELAGREANPGDALTRETDAARFGADHPWSRSEVGYQNTITELSVADVDEFLRTRLTPKRAVAAVVGPIEPAAAREHLLPFLGSTPRILPEALPAEPAESPVHREYNSITTWLAVSYPFPASPDTEALRLLADLVTQSLSFGPSRRSVYDVQGSVVPRVGDGEIRFQMVIPPGEAELWTDRIRETMSRFADDSLPETTFRDRLRHYRGRRLLELSTPEARAAEAGRQLLLTGRPAPLTELEELSAERLQAAARSLSEPVVVFLGPTEDREN